MGEYCDVLHSDEKDEGGLLDIRAGSKAWGGELEAVGEFAERFVESETVLQVFRMHLKTGQTGAL